MSEAFNQASRPIAVRNSRRPVGPLAPRAQGKRGSWPTNTGRLVTSKDLIRSARRAFDREGIIMPDHAHGPLQLGERAPNVRARRDYPRGQDSHRRFSRREAGAGWTVSRPALSLLQASYRDDFAAHTSPQREGHRKPDGREHAHRTGAPLSPVSSDARRCSRHPIRSGFHNAPLDCPICRSARTRPHGRTRLQ